MLKTCNFSIKSRNNFMSIHVDEHIKSQPQTMPSRRSSKTEMHLPPRQDPE
jgi:hypothetical protein